MIVTELCQLAENIVSQATAKGAHGVEVMVRDGAEMSAKVRLGEPELVEEAQSRAVGIRVVIDNRQAVTSTSDLRPDALAAMVAETVKLASISEPDEHAGLPDPALYAQTIPDLDLYDEGVAGIDAAYALAQAKAAEAAARGLDPRITNSEGASFSRTTGAAAFATSGGFVHGYLGSYVGLSVEPIADDADGKKRNGSYWTASRHQADLDDPEAVGIEAARRTVAQLGARKVETCEVPVVFDREAARSIIGTVFSIANGSAFYRKSSYLVGREGTPVASSLLSVDDDPLIARAPGSRPFDGDGLASRRNTLIEAGILKTVLCDVYSARRLGRESTGSAGRGVGGGSSPSSSNLVVRPGQGGKDDIVTATERGLYVTSMMGFGFSPITGDFSRGASGFWIENGELSFPVTEITISANFDDLLKRIDKVGADIDTRTSVR
ncbi:MAG TPA: metallopeptidase TldD-related protein, partial [Kofleriaceae bacterium]|nr:metallopeptidase TldD-related protein [Kofleriaceae bacterium]